MTKGRAFNPTSPVTQLCCQYIRGQRERMTKSSRLKVIGGALTGSTILNDVVTDLLSVGERAKASAFDSRNVHEYVRAAVIRLNEAEALGGVEPFYGASVHNDFLSKQS
jgi:hypothetical protein